MVIVKVIGGIGNQMFQYAFYMKMKSLGKDVRLYISDYKEDAKVKYMLDKFHVSFDEATKLDLKKYIGIGGKISGAGRRLAGKKPFVIYDERLDVGYQPEVLDIDDGVIGGYWQCEKYFKDISGDVRKVFSFTDDMLSNKCREIACKIESVNATSVHIRRGDYLLPENAQKYSGICTEEYYKKAMDYIRERFADTKFFFFSDDPEWVRDNLCGDGDVVVDCNTGDDSYLDIYLMSKCKNNIIANSSFSWWGAWINSNPNKMVIAPHRWFKHYEVSDAICEDWIKV